MLFQGWGPLLRTIVVGVTAYALLVMFLRISGKRTLSKLNAFDLVVTVALGSTLSSILINQRVSLAQGALAIGLLIALQFTITWSSVRAPWLRRIMAGEPTMLLYRGMMLHAAMRRTRVSEEEIRAAARGRGFASLDDIGAIVLETDGSLSVMGNANAIDANQSTSLKGVHRPAMGNQ